MGVVLTLGKFDGLHRGHQDIVRRVLTRAKANGAEAVALVLHPHPALVLAGITVPVISSAADRLAGLRRLGIDRAEVLPFTAEMAALTPEAFIARLRARFDLRAMVVGPDFAFGRGRSGSLDVLRNLGREAGFTVEVAPGMQVDDEQVSSARIRSLLTTGDVVRARRLMAAPFSLVGTVVHGAKRGRQLGYPTANLALIDDYVVPANGVYAVRCRVEDGAGADGPGADSSLLPEPWLLGAANIGVRPQFDAGARSIEVFLMDFDGDLYGRKLRMAFVERIRDEMRFASVEALVARMGEDVVQARRVLAEKDRMDIGRGMKSPSV